MPFYRTVGSIAGDHGVFPQRPATPQVAKSKRDEYLHMEKHELIALCDERGILSLKGGPIGRNQRKPFYIAKLTEWDQLHALD